MDIPFRTTCLIAAMLIVALAGIFQLIDQNSMIVMAVVLACCFSNSRRRCIMREKA